VDDAVTIDDLARPTFSPEVADVLVAMDAMADGCPLDAAALHARASAETGLTDFGPRDYEERLGVLLDALRSVDGLAPYGRVTFHAQLVQLLRNRLLLVDLLARHPEIRERELAAPIVIAGLPRTGTTHMHNLLAADPGLRTLPYWESLEPVPLPAEAGAEPDPRRERTELAVGFLNQLLPLFPLMHEMTADHVHEEIQLLAIDFSTMFFETLAPVPAWEAYYRSHDQTPHYRFLRLVLQALAFERGGDRWVLKSPQHLEQLPVLTSVFPDATVVLTHRDPADVVLSMVTMITYCARSFTRSVDVTGMARRWADRIADLLGACLRDRAVLAPDRSIDLRFDDVLADELGAVRAVYGVAGRAWSAPTEELLAGYLADHPRGRLGRIDYRFEDVGLDREELDERFADYRAAFLADRSG
jgi:Sulfotransferase family